MLRYFYNKKPASDDRRLWDEITVLPGGAEDSHSCYLKR